MLSCNVAAWPLNSAVIRNPWVVSSQTLLRDAVALITDIQTEELNFPNSQRASSPSISQDLRLHVERSSCVVVVDAGKVAGILTQRDIARFIVNTPVWQDAVVQQALVTPPLIVQESGGLSVGSVLDLLVRHHTEHLILVDQNQQLTGLLTQGILCQASQQQQMNICLQADEQRNIDLLQILPIGICRKNIAKENIYVNNRYCEIFGLSQAEALGDDVVRCVLSDDQQDVLAVWQSLTIEQHPFQLEYRFHRPDGVVIWIHEQWVVEYGDDGCVNGYAGTITDISDRKETELALGRSEAQKQAILSSIPDYLFRVDAHGVYREVVTYQQDVALFSADIDPVGLTMADVLPEDVAIRQQRYLTETLLSGKLQTYEQQVLRGNHICDEEVRVIKSGKDEVLFIIRDISERKQAERQLQSLVEGTAATTGQDFFPALARHLAATLDVSHAMVTELIGDQLHTLAFWSSGAPQSALSYALAQTPCERSLKEGEFYCASRIQQAFPNDADLAEMEVESYLGIALKDVNGNAIGNLCVLDSKPIQLPERSVKILRAFGARATAEVERQRAQASLEQLNQALEIKVAERTAELLEREQFLQTVLDTFPLAVFWKDIKSVYLGFAEKLNRNLRGYPIAQTGSVVPFLEARIFSQSLHSVSVKGHIFV
ncbi:MAG: PAS domain S-box protein [Cyanobacteria bacterium P01_D01_bin.156]